MPAVSDGLKGKLIKADVAWRCCREAVRIAVQTMSAYWYGAMAEIWVSEVEPTQLYTAGFVPTPKSPEVEAPYRQGWEPPGAKPGPGMAVIAVGAIILSVLDDERARAAVQTVVETADSALRTARGVGTLRGQMHCRACMAGNTLSQAKPRKWVTRRERARM